MEKLHLQLQELLVGLWPVPLAQQELEYAALGSGAVLLHVRGSVAATGKEGSLFRSSDNSQPWAHLALGQHVQERVWGRPLCMEPAGAVLSFLSHSPLGRKRGFLATSLISGSYPWPAFPVTMLLLTAMSSLWPRGAPI